jgi:hypothetical protein
MYLPFLRAANLAKIAFILLFDYDLNLADGKNTGT